MKTWFTARATHGVAELSIYDEIGSYGVPAKAFIDEMKALGNISELTLRINSPGGSVFDGIAIYNALKRHPAKVIVTVEGLAASIASVILCAGDEVVMPKNALIMIHDPSAVVMGSARDMRSMAEALDKMRDGLVSAYQDKTGRDQPDIVEWMAQETWFDAEEAMKAGFADRIEEPVAMAATFDLSKFTRVPTALASLPNQTPPENVAEQSPENTETKMTEKPNTEPDTTTGNVPAEDAGAETKANDNVIDLDQVRAQERKATLSYVSEINQLCALAGTPEMASGFIAKATSPEIVRTKLLEARAEEDDASAVSATGRNHTPKPSEPTIDTAAIYAARNKSVR